MAYNREQYISRRDKYRQYYKEHRNEGSAVWKAEGNSIPTAKAVKNAYKWHPLNEGNKAYKTFAYDRKSYCRLYYPKQPKSVLQVVYNCYVPFYVSSEQIKAIDKQLRKLFSLKLWQSITTCDKCSESHRCEYLSCTITATLQLVDCDCLPAVETMQAVEKIIRHALHADYI